MKSCNQTALFKIQSTVFIFIQPVLSSRLIENEIN